MSTDLLWHKVVKAVAGWAGAGAAILGAGIIGYQALGWLQTAKWKPYTIEEALFDLGVPYFHTSFLGVQKIIDAVMQWPASLGCLILAIVFGWISLRAAEAETKIELEQNRLKRLAAGKREPQTLADLAYELEAMAGPRSRERDHEG